MTGKIQRLLLLNLPYVLIALLATKLGDIAKAEGVSKHSDPDTYIRVVLLVFRRVVYPQN
jgi:hypothetical protein